MSLPSARAAAPTALVAAVFLVTVELLRATSPLLDRVAGESGVIGAARLAVLIFAAPVLLGLLALLRPVPASGVLVLTLVALRLVAQGQDPVGLVVAGAGAAVGVAALLQVVRLVTTVRSGVTATLGVLLGTGADLAIRAGYGSWDPIFRPGLGPWLVAGTVAAVAVAALVGTAAGRWALPGVRAGRVAALGPYLGLYVMAYGSAPVLAAHGGVPLVVASAGLLVAVALAMELVRRLRLPGGTGAVPEPDRWFAGLVAGLALVAGVAVGYRVTGPAAVAGLVVAGIAAAVLLARALTPRGATGEPGPAARAVGFAVAGLAGGLGYLVPVMVYQIHYELMFPFDNRYALLVAAVLLAGAGTGARPPAAAADRRPLLTRPAFASTVVAAALVVPLVTVVSRPAAAPEQAGDTVRLMSWNVMYGRGHTSGNPDPSSIAAAIEAVDPDLVLLQEVSRGWPIGGGVDLLEYLSRRLGMRYVWSPAADGLFGNALLARVPLTEVETGRLPFGQGPMHRSYLAATVPLAGGGDLRVFNVHLQHRTGNTPTRLAQSEAVFAAWGGRPHTVIAGDFNFWPSWPEAQVWRAAGFESAQDLAGQSDAFTVPSDRPDNRVDWIFGTPDLTFSGFRILDGVTTSDHLPLVVTVGLD